MRKFVGIAERNFRSDNNNVSPGRCSGKYLRVIFASLLFFIFTLAAPLPGHADTLDNILTLLSTAGVIDSAIIDAKPLIECLVTKGDPAQCVNVQQLATQQLDDAKNEAMSEAEKQAQQFLPEDPAIQAVVDIVRAAYKEDWLKVLELAGVKLLGQIACKAGLSWSGPLNPFICGEWAATVLDKAEPVVHETIQVIASWPNVNLWKLVTLFDFEFACEVSPDIPLKDEVCSVLGQAFVALADLGSDLVSAVSDSLESVNEFIAGGGGTMMTADQYYNHLVRPLMFRRALERLMLGRQDLGMDPAEIKQCLAYGSLVFGSKCNSEMSPRLRKEAEALVAYLQTIPETYYQGWLAPVARQRALTRYSFDEAGAYKQFIDKLPASQWEALVQGSLPLYMYIGGGEEDKAFYKQIFQECKFRVDDMIYGQGAAIVYEPDLAPGSLVNWTCYQAVGKHFAAEYIKERQRIIDVVIPGISQLGCPVKPDGSALEFECLTYTSWDLCLEIMGTEYGINDSCNLDRINAAKALGQELTTILGTKRSIYMGYHHGNYGDFEPRVQSTRPWKKESCEALLESFGVRNPLVANRIEVQCTYWETPEFKEQQQFAKELLAALNNVAGGQVGASNKCRQMWDPLRISCYGHQEMPELPEQFADKNIQACPPDPNRDGVDEVCYMADWTLSTKNGNLDQQGVTQNSQLPPAAEKTPLPPPGTSSGDSDSSTVKMSDQPAPTVKAATESAPVVVTVQGQPPVGGPIPVTSGQHLDSCSFDLTYLAAQSPVLEASSDSLAVGDQVRISCRFVEQTRRVEWPVCDEESRKTIGTYSSASDRGHKVVSGIVAVDGQPVNVANIPAGRTEFEKTATWSFRQAGSHEVSCQVNNPLGATVRGADPYLTETVILEVGPRGGDRPAAGFDAAQARTLNTRVQDSPTALIPAMRGRPAPSDSRSGPGETMQENPPVRIIPPDNAVNRGMPQAAVPGSSRDLPGATRTSPQKEDEIPHMPR